MHEAAAPGGGAPASEAPLRSSHLANASSAAASYLALKKVDPAKAKAFLKASMAIKDNATDTVASAIGDAAILAAQRLFNLTFG